MAKGDDQDLDDPVLHPGEAAPVENDVGIPGAFAVAGGIAGFVAGAALAPVLGFGLHPLCVIAGAVGGWFGGAQLLALRYEPDDEEEEEVAAESAPSSSPPAAAPPADPLSAPTPMTPASGPSSELDHSLGSKVADDASGLDHSLGSNPSHERPPG